MKKRTAAMLVIIFAAAFLLGADLSFFDVHLYGKAGRVLNDMLPENTSYIVPIIDGQTNNSSAEGEKRSPDPLLEADASAFESVHERAAAMYNSLSSRFLDAGNYAYRMKYYYSYKGYEQKVHVMETINAMTDCLDMMLDDIWRNELNSTYDNSKAVMNEIRYLRDYASRTFMEIYMGADITPELFEEYAEQYEAGMSLKEILG